MYRTILELVKGTGSYLSTFTRVPQYLARDSADLAALSELTVSTAERNAHDISQGSLCSDGMVSGAAVRLRGFWRIVAGRRGVIGHG